MQEEGTKLSYFGVEVTYIYLARLEICQKPNQNGTSTDCNPTRFLKNPERARMETRELSG